MNFEQVMKQIEDCVLLLENGELTLEESVAAYEKGANLIKQAEAILSESKGRLSILGLDDKLNPFEEEF